MSALVLNPENALKRANEFISLGKCEEAMGILIEVLKNRKHKVFTNVYEIILDKYLELCVDFNHCQAAKDGLYLYRTICQGVNFKSWVDCVSRFHNLAEHKVESSRKQSELLTLEVNLDENVVPENLLKYVSCDDSNDRVEKLCLIPCVKFLYECYRISIELLRNSQTEKFYHQIVQKTFKFCLKYSRKTEFRKLCNLLKNNLDYLRKKQLPSKINKSDVQALFLETGLNQLETAIKLELWQDVFKSIEDVHVICRGIENNPNSRNVVNYYEKLSVVFWKAQNILFHSAALFRYFLLTKELKKNFTAAEASRIAIQVVLATLSIPLPLPNPSLDLIVETDENILEKKSRSFSTLLDFRSKPCRASLIKDLELLGIIQFVPREIQDFLNFFEHESRPLELGFKVKNIFKFILGLPSNDNLVQYIQPLMSITMVRLLSELSDIYATITFKRLSSLMPICIDSHNLETHIAESARRYEMVLRIDQANQCVHFISKSGVLTHRKLVEINFQDSFLDCKSLNALSLFYSTLKKIVAHLLSNNIKIMNLKTRRLIARQYIFMREISHREILERKKMIEKLKEKMEKIRVEKEEAEKQLIINKKLKYAEKEKERLLKETEDRNVQRIQKLQLELKQKMITEKVEILRKTQIGSHIVDNLDLTDIKILDPDFLLSKQIEQLIKERKEFLSRLRRQEKIIDHIERAKRIEELPLLKSLYDESKINDKLLWEDNEKRRVQIANEKQDQLLRIQRRKSLMKLDIEPFVEQIKARKQNEYEKQLSKFKKQLAVEKEKRLKLRAEERKAQRKTTWKQREAERRKHEKMTIYKRSRYGRDGLNEEKTKKMASNTDFSIIDGTKKDRTGIEFQRTNYFDKPTTYSNFVKQKEIPQNFISELNDNKGYYHILKGETDSCHTQRNGRLSFRGRDENTYDSSEFCTCSRRDISSERQGLIRLLDNRRPRSAVDTPYKAMRWRRRMETDSSRERERPPDMHLQESDNRYILKHSCTPWAKNRKDNETK